MIPLDNGTDARYGYVAPTHPVSGFPLLPDSRESCRSCAYAASEDQSDTERPTRCMALRRELFSVVAERSDGWENAATKLVNQADTLWGYSTPGTNYRACARWVSREAETVVEALARTPTNTSTVSLPTLF